jgi:hypothetical protein
MNGKSEKRENVPVTGAAENIFSFFIFTIIARILVDFCFLFPILLLREKGVKFFHGLGELGLHPGYAAVKNE